MQHTIEKSSRGLFREAALRVRRIPADAVQAVVGALPKKPRQPIEKAAVPPKPYTGPGEIPPVDDKDPLTHFRRHCVVVEKPMGLRKVG